ncbi:MAG: hypothetical protein WA960_03975 [Tunicatimonas sp.]
MSQTYRTISILVTAGTLLLSGCAPPSNETAASAPTEAADFSNGLPPVFAQALEAHGGLAQWRAQQRLEYDVYRKGTLLDHQLVALRSRKVLLTGDDYTIGYDGTHHWVSPDTAAFPGDVRFYHNLQFYFMALPFLFADPGIRYEPLKPRTIREKTYDGVRISFDPGVGDASDDAYLAYFDPDTHHLTWLLYTVTYFSGAPNEKYSARWYQAWHEVNGLLLPERVISYCWEENALGEVRDTTVYRNVEISNIPPDESMFLMPNEAMAVGESEVE